MPCQVPNPLQTSLTWDPKEVFYADLGQTVGEVLSQGARLGRLIPITHAGGGGMGRDRSETGGWWVLMSSIPAENVMAYACMRRTRPLI